MFCTRLSICELPSFSLLYWKLFLFHNASCFILLQQFAPITLPGCYYIKVSYLWGHCGNEFLNINSFFLKIKVTRTQPEIFKIFQVMKFISINKLFFIKSNLDLHNIVHFQLLNDFYDHISLFCMLFFLCYMTFSHYPLQIYLLLVVFLKILFLLVALKEKCRLMTFQKQFTWACWH